jgi:hypothetical protein
VQEGSSSIIRLEYLTFIGVIPHAFKGKLESPHPPLSRNQEKIIFYKGKGLGKGIPTHVGHASISSGLWMLVGSGARLVTLG